MNLTWPPEREVVELLRRGTLRVVEHLPRASNFSFLAEVSGGGTTLPAVYKPRDGETPLWDFPEGTLCGREVAAYMLADALGWPAVPPTVLRDGPHGPGAVQLFVEAEPGEHFFTLRERRPDDFRTVAAFDAVANNADRKSGHCLLGDDGSIWCIDHGVCFAVEPKLRTVIWEFAGEPVPAALLADVDRVAAELRDGPLGAEMAGLLEREEIEAAARRAEGLVARGLFPLPGPGRIHPWPAV